MSKLQFSAAIFALIFGLGVMAISLNSTSANFSVKANTASQKQFYFSRSIQPDHVLYPGLVMIDRLRLEAAHPENRIMLQLQYARDRYAHSEALLDKDESELAFSTILKGQKYLVHAAGESKSLNLNSAKQNYIQNEVGIFCQRLIDIKPRFSDAQRAELEQLIGECQTIF